MLAGLSILFNTATAPFIHNVPVPLLFSQLNPRDSTGIKPIIH
ncbi:BgTH12-03766 [Blumeria graminis f. sp. triticale]|uniref:BgTH12-03766 n=1 Tax=Blumeria graminis f. sp. triticale TaxID=1689686 RepID=A0A9W4GCR8_BLUGR|nr:BgTH12-03766 [Blumeria graminis f. sp. triticale]